jgi:hypothetical protein
MIELPRVQPEKPPTGTLVVKLSLKTWFQPGRLPTGIAAPEGLAAVGAVLVTPIVVSGSEPPVGRVDSGGVGAVVVVVGVLVTTGVGVGAVVAGVVVTGAVVV